jgi:hypothetical protein
MNPYHPAADHLGVFDATTSPPEIEFDDDEVAEEHLTAYAGLCEEDFIDEPQWEQIAARDLPEPEEDPITRPVRVIETGFRDRHQAHAA